MKHGVISRKTDVMFPYHGWPTVARDEKGNLYAVCSAHRISHICPFGKNYMFKSEDGAESWSNPMVINDTMLDDRDAGILNLGGGKMLMTYFNHPRDFYIKNAEEFLNHGREDAVDLQRALYMGAIEYLKGMPSEYNNFGSFIRISENYGASFGDAIKVPVSSPHGPTKLRDGRLLYLGKERGSGVAERAGHILAYDSADGGLTWNFLYDIEFPEGCGPTNMHEPYAIELSDGTILGAIRAQSEPVEPNFTIYFTRSYDGGKTWTSPEATGFFGSPPHLLELSSGDVLLSYGRRKKPYGECVRISRDGGKSFGEEMMLCGAPTTDLGYPSSVELDDGSIVTVYYQFYGDDKHCSLLYTKWNIEEYENK